MQLSGTKMKARPPGFRTRRFPTETGVTDDVFQHLGGNDDVECGIRQCYGRQYAEMHSNAFAAQALNRVLRYLEPV
jgi:hypothetical protein